MTLKLGIVMDPIGAIKKHKDSSFAMLLEAQSRGWELHYLEYQQLYLCDGEAHAWVEDLQVDDGATPYYQLTNRRSISLASLDVILMRKDPPVDKHYLHATYLLEQAERQGTLIVNKPQSLRDMNEKLAATWFPTLCPTTIVSAEQTQLKDFLDQHGDIIVKPLDGMGGASIFRLQKEDANVNVILETLTQFGKEHIIAQCYIPAVQEQGDKRILLIDGEPVDYALARLPAKGETRANLAAGGSGIVVELTQRDRLICEQVGPVLRERGILFAGIDVIGDYLIEINVTSPTCIREIERETTCKISAQLMDVIANAILPPI